MCWAFAAVDSFVITDGRRDLITTARLIGGPNHNANRSGDRVGCEAWLRQGRGGLAARFFAPLWTSRLWHPCWRPNCVRLFGRPIESTAPCASEQ